ncbi:MAG: COR domain-containing protein [Cyanobacteria bacterium P01_F01_bin.143]
MSGLTDLNLRDNQLEILPNSIGNLFNLTKLNLWNNNLKILPESIGNLSKLTYLSLRDNQLTNLPESIGNLSRLIKLVLWKNKLKKLPATITKAEKLKDLNIRDNPLDIPPMEVAAKGIKAIKKYFEQLQEEGTAYIYEAKLLIVGEAGAGKTSLAKKIQNANYILQDNENSTEGIDVIKWNFSLGNEEKFQVNIWDFGGQEIYHATHQFFLTKRSLYTLVVDSRKENTDFYYWLNLVELLSDDSPLLIIKNEKQDRQKEINERALRGQFTNLKETLATNLASNRGLEEILANIQDYIKKLPHIGQALPKTWVQVRQALENDERNHISLQEYLDICESNGFTKLEDKLQLSGYLHDLGVCLHFQDKEDSLLYRTVILQPEWGTDAVYQVLDNKEVVNNQGCFTRNNLKNICQEEKYSSMRGELLELMKKFQLCYEISGRKDTFIAPQLLSDNQAEYDWDESKNLIFRYSYSDFMPKGIVSRFIVIMHQYIDQQKYVWKTGVILNRDNTKAEVIEYYGKREIKIRMSGDHQRELLSNIIYELDKIHDSYNRLNYSKLIPCNCNQCKDSQSPHFYPFETLKQFKSDKQYEIQCQKSYRMVNVLSLIDNIENFQKSLPQDKQDISQPINVQGNYINQSRKIKISKSTVNDSGTSAFNLGDISGNVARTINQLPSFDDEPNKKELKQLLNQLQNIVLETDLDQEDQEETLEKVQEIAEALQDNQNRKLKRKAKSAMLIIQEISDSLPSNVSMAIICNQLPELIAKIF